MIEIIPAIDIIDGKCVRLTEGDYSRKTVYSDSPADVAKQFEDAGVRRLHLVDLDGAKSGSVKNLAVLEAVSTVTDLLVDFGGGIKTENELRSVLNAGAGYATVGSLVVQKPEEFQRWISIYGSDRFFIGADVRDNMIAVSGWQEQTDVDVVDFIRSQMSNRVHYFFCTDISKDGKLEGTSEELYRKLIARCPGIRLVASGGVTGMEDIVRLEEIGCEGVIVGKAIYENRITMKELERFNSRTN
jgi:phosphoribosylformimino-5-aminoimidazole carboxamide ribotide isomerase